LDAGASGEVSSCRCGAVRVESRGDDVRGFMLGIERACAEEEEVAVDHDGRLLCPACVSSGF